jgi:hypothetical protein
MNDGRCGASPTHRSAALLIILFLMVGLSGPSFGSGFSRDRDQAAEKPLAFDFFCKERQCQFWLTDPSLMLASDLQIEWRLGDGTISHEPAPLHQYPHEGRFRPELIVRRNERQVLLRSETVVTLGFEPTQPVSDIGALFSGSDGSWAGYSVAGLGDFNFSGRGDLAIGAPSMGQGEVYVVFGNDYEVGDVVPLINLDGSNGFRVIPGESEPESIGISVAGLGAIAPGVSRALAIGAPGFTQGPIGPGFIFSGTGYVSVIHGSAAPFDASINFPVTDEAQGFTITGPASEAFGFSVSSAGDFNDDGFEDFVIGSPQATDAEELVPLRGRTYIVFGREGGFPGNIDILELDPEDVLVFEGGGSNHQTGWSVAGIGDFNGNEFSDIIIGAPWIPFLIPGDPGDPVPMGIGGSIDGAAFVVFGGDDFDTENPIVLDGEVLDGQRGFAIVSPFLNDLLGFSVAAVGDLNNNSSTDLAVSAPGAPYPGEIQVLRGAVHVLFGGNGDTFGTPFNTATDLNGSNGFSVIGLIDVGDVVESVPPTIAIGSAGDINDNGFDDLLIGLPDANGGMGRVVVIFGRDGVFPHPIDVSQLQPEDGFIITGTALDGRLGQSVSGLGDFIGNGMDDIAIGAPGGDESSAGGWVIAGQPEPGPPLINDGDGIADQQAPFTSIVEIEFEVSDLIDAPEDLTVEAFSGNPDLLPDNALETGGAGALRTLTINTSLGSPGTVPIVVLVTNTFDLTTEVVFTLDIVLQPPLINEGLGFEQQTLFAGQPLEIEFTVSDPQDAPEDIQVMAVSQSPELAPPEGISILGTGGTRTLRVETIFSTSGVAQIDVEATNSFGLSTVEELVIVIDATPAPVINNGVGIADQEMIVGQTLEIDFTVADPEFGPEALTVVATSGDTGVLPNEQLTILGAGVNRTLRIETFAANIGATPITIQASNPLGGEDAVTFNLTITALPPSINDGAGFPLQQIFAGQILELDFTVSDQQDAPEAIQVTVTSQTPDLIPPGGVSIEGAGGTRTLRIETPIGGGGIGQVDVEAINSFGLSTVEELVVVIDATPAPIINDGEGIEDQQMVAGESLAIDFTVEDPEFDPDSLDISVVSGNAAVLPGNQISIAGSGAERILVIDTNAGNIGTTPITVEARNPLGGEGSATFSLTIVAAPPAINDGEPIDDAEIRAGENLTIDFTVSDPLDPAEVLEIIIESSNPELIPVEAISISGTGNERTLTIATQPGTLGQSVITVTVINSNGQQDVREFLVEVFLLPTDLELAAEPFVLPGFPDLLLRLSAANVGEETAFGILMAADIPEPFEAIGVFIEAQGCLVDDGAVACDDELLPAWECSLFDGALVCQLESLEAEREAGVVLRIQGDGQADMIALLEALNAPQVSTELELGF